jgi:CubicO group peptidase (beta-lactamase class C family)
MKLKRLTLLLAAMCVVSACQFENANAAKPESRCAIRQSKTTFAADVLKPYVDSGKLPGAINIFCKGNVQETACVGWADVDKKIPMSLDRTYMQCSQTKGFCGVTIAILVEEGKISLDDPVAKYLPEFKNLKVAVKDKQGKTSLVPAKNVLTIRMVMNHTGGFPFEIPTKNKKGWPSLPLRATAKEAASRPLAFEPGTAVRYSNTGIDIGAAVTEVVTGKPWDVFLKERVLDPLGMKDTTFNPTDEQLSRSISMYMLSKDKKPVYRKFNGAMPLPHNGPTVFPSAGAGLWTTAADQVKFYRMLMNLGVGDNGVRILKEETVKNLLATSTRPAKLGGYSMGLIANFKVGTMGHGGAWGTTCTVNWRKKELSLWVVQQNGNPRPWMKDRNNAASKFFASKFDDSETQAYTGRTK